LDPDAVWGGNGIGRGPGVLDGVVIVEGKEQHLVNLGRPIVTDKDFVV